MASPVANTIPLTGDPLKDGLIEGGSWVFVGAHVLTYSFNLNYGTTGPGPGGAWTAPLSTAFTKALATWSNVADIGFTNVNSGTYFFESTADMAVALTGNDLQQKFSAAGLGFFPDPATVTSLIEAAGKSRAQYPRPEGDVLLDNYYAGYNYLDDGGYGLWAMVHEIGHALGLKHPFDAVNGRPTFASSGFGGYDNQRYTVMSYVGSGSLATGNSATPMPLDILAIQQIYGANTTFHTGDDTYTAIVDGAMRTIWDAGGIDTLDGSGLSGGVSLDLRPGALMDLGAGTVLGIAYNCSIENAAGGGGSDTLYGNDGNNMLSDGAGDDTFYGGNGNDTMAGGAGANRYHGGAGDDVYIVSSAQDVVFESIGEGIDTVQSSVSITQANLADQGVEYVLLTGSANIDAFADMQALALIGNSGNNVLDGSNTGATLQGGAGDDTYVIGNTAAGVVESADEGIDTVNLNLAVDYALPANVERLVVSSVYAGFATLALSGNALDNWISGAGGANTLDGSAGADTLIGAGGADTYVIDNPGDVIIEVQDYAVDTVRSAISLALPETIERLVLSGNGALDGSGNALDNQIVGNDDANHLAGGAGADVLDGAGGDDSLDGGSGFDWMRGGAGNDTYVIDSLLPATALTLLHDTGDAAKAYFLTSANTSFSTYVYDFSNDGIADYVALQLYCAATNMFFNLSFDTSQTGRYLTTGTYAGADHGAPQAGHVAFNVSGGGGVPVDSSGTIGDFTIMAAQFDYSTPAISLVSFGAIFDLPGTHAIRGAISYNYDSGLAETVLEGIGGGADTVQTQVSMAMPDNVENLLFTTTTTGSRGTGNALDNSMTGNSGNDSLDGGEGNDSLSGGPGFDTLIGGTGDDTLRGGDQADSMVGGAGNDFLYGGKGLDTLDGGDGNDILAGLIGNDSLIGGNGIDTADYSASSDGVTADLLAGTGGSTIPVVGVGAGTDTLSGIENLIGSLFADSLTGDLGNNALTGNAGNDTMLGNDGFDTLDGGDGDDSLSGMNQGDVINGGNGNDWLGGGKGLDLLDGGPGNDTLQGGLGTDTLTGGSGADTFIFSTALDGTVNVDTITDFVSGTDVFQLSAATFGFFAAQVNSSVGLVADVLTYNPTTGVLAYDADGAGSGPSLSFAILGTSTHPASLGIDFLIVA